MLRLLNLCYATGNHPCQFATPAVFEQHFLSPLHPYFVFVKRVRRQPLKSNGLFLLFVTIFKVLFAFRD